MIKNFAALIAHTGLFTSVLRKGFITLALVLVLMERGTSNAQALVSPDCTDMGVLAVNINPEKFGSGEINEMKITIDARRLANNDYRVVAYSNKTDDVPLEHTGFQKKDDSTTTMTFVLRGNALKQNFGEWGDADTRTLYLDKKDWNPFDRRWCTLDQYEVTDDPSLRDDDDRKKNPSGKCEISVWQSAPPSVGAGQKCYFPNSCVESTETIYVKVTNLRDNDGSLYSGNTQLVIGQENWYEYETDRTARTISPGEVQFDFNPDINQAGTYTLGPIRGGVEEILSNCNKKITIDVSGSCPDDACDTEEYIFNTNPYAAQPYMLCEQINDAAMMTECLECSGPDGGQAAGIWTAVGCVPTQSDGIIRVIMKIGLGVGGGVALIMILSASFMLSTSQGEPKRANDAKDLLSSAIIGLLFIIFSITILQFIGVQVLQIPGFGT